VEYLNEIKEFAISGKVISKTTKLPQKDISVSLSEPQHKELNTANKTDDKGRFVFSLPEVEGKHDFYIQAGSKDSLPSEIWIVSIAQKSIIDTIAQYSKPNSTSSENNYSDIEYLPEIRGITISGKAIDQAASLPKKDILVSLSEPQHGEYFSVYHTNDNGRFIFSLPDMHGKHDFFIQAESPSEILVDEEFCNRPVILPYIAFKLNKDEKEVVKEMVINEQLNERFMTNEDTLANAPYPKPVPVVFYGSKKKIYYTDKYIELPDIEEFIVEIIQEAIIINDKNKRSFISMKREDFGQYQPLILMDNIQVSNDERLLKTPLNRIVRVEVINKDYVVGEMKYDGIMSFYSRNKNVAGLDLNKNSMFFTYELFSDTEPGYDYIKRPADSRIPDIRNLLYWDPDLKLSHENKTTISFFTPDCKGDYIVFIRSKNNSDNCEVYGKCYFSVK
jgi:hypothetical protein